ncbi:MAG: argininosuccinate lyase [Thermodesulfovibrionales bacterium]|nr:argininosuccinate lyase [Thermodesulfovibrionales bacterium]
MKKPWSGRFKEKTADIVEKYTESISFDKRLWKQDIEGSIAHAKMLAKQGIISDSDLKEILIGLTEIYREIEDGKFKFDIKLEDIHMHIEAALIKKIGEAGSKLHTARSRNDQVSLDLRLYLKEEIREIIALLLKIEFIFTEVAEKHLTIVMPGYTHLQRAQPVLLSHHLMAYAHMFDRDRMRLQDTLKRLDVSPLGACALAGTSLNIDRKYVSEILDFHSVSQNSIDSVSDRDFAIEFLSNSAILMMHISRLAEELILWSTEEFSFIELPDAFTTGSSIMPQKKNPDVLELMRGKTGRIYGNLISLLTTMKGLPLSYNRDMQEDKEPIFDTVDTLKMTLNVIIELLPNIIFNSKRMAETVQEGFLTATDIAEYLVRKGLPFRMAHELTGKMVRYCIDNNKRFKDLTLEEYKNFSTLFSEDIYNYVDPFDSINSKRSEGGTARELVIQQISQFRRKLQEL